MKKMISFEEYDSKVIELSFYKGISLDTTLDLLNNIYEVKPREKCKECGKTPPLKNECYCSYCRKELQEKIRKASEGFK
jgi:tRNA(Ile)-lysidine synthase TilS/MesJ